MQKNTIISCFVLYITIHISIINGTHFEGGTITYKILNTSGSIVSIVLTQTYIYDYTRIYCNNSMIANQSPQLYFNPGSPYFYQENSQVVNCTQYCNQSGGYKPPSVVTYCTDYSTGLGITVGQRSDVINITNGSYFIVAYQSLSWRQLTIPPTSGVLNTTWSISCLINLRLRPDGTYNNPPVATIISPIDIPVGIQQSIFIPTIDADGDQVRCRFANGTHECGLACPPGTLPNGTKLYSNCTLIITGMAAGDWYAIAIEIEDFIDSTSTTPLSSVPIQFLINVQSISSCAKRPLLTGPVTKTGDCVGIQVGQPYVIELIAENFCSNTTYIKDIATLSFPVVIKTPIVQNSTTLWSITLTWIPTAAAVGSKILCAVAIDSTNVQSNQFCIAFSVAQGTVPTCPGQAATTNQVTTYTTMVTTQSTSTKVTTQITSTPSSFATVSTSLLSTLHTIGSTVGSSSVSTVGASTSVTSLPQTSPSVSTWFSTTSTTPTSQSSFQYTTYTSLMTTVQSTIISTTAIPSTSIPVSSQSSSTLTSQLSTTSTNPSSQLTSQDSTATSSSSTYQSTLSLTTALTSSTSISSVSTTASTSSSLTSQSSYEYSTYLSSSSTTQLTTSSITTDPVTSVSITTESTSSSQSNVQYTTNISQISSVDSTTIMISTSQSSQYSATTITNSFDISTNTIQTPIVTVPSTTVLQQVSNASQTSNTTKSVETSSVTSNSSSSWPWVAVALSIPLLILLGLCIYCCCWSCCLRLCLCCPYKRRRRRSSVDELQQKDDSRPPSTNSHLTSTSIPSNLYLNDDLLLATRPPSAISTRTTNDIQLSGLTSTREENTLPHYATPLQRNARVAPASTSPNVHLFDNRPASKTSDL